jgi:hypothetical protein
VKEDDGVQGVISPGSNGGYTGRRKELKMSKHKKPAVRESDNQVEYTGEHIDLAVVQKEANALGRSILIERDGALYRVHQGLDPDTAQDRFDYQVMTYRPGTTP